MKSFLLSPVLIIALAGVAHSAGYVMNLGAAAPGDQLVPIPDSIGVDGWTQSEANNAADQPKAFIATVNTSTGIAVGAYYDDFANNPFYANREVSLALDGSSLSLTVGLLDSTDLFPERNDFSIGLLDSGGNNLATINFFANTTTYDPNIIGSWNVSINGNTAFAAVQDNSSYDILISFAANGTNIDYDVSLTDYQATPNVVTDDGTLTGAATETISNLRLGVDLGLSAAFGDNFMGVTNVSLIPEPSTTLLVGLAGIGLALRRKRA